LAFDPPLGGTVTDTVALPAVHETVFGSPESAGDEANTQVFVAVTEAESWTDPPAWGSTVGVAVNEVILGGTALALVTVVVGRADGLAMPGDLW
jgi:hypothetical protein